MFDGNDFLISQNQITDWIDKGYSSEVIAGTDYITTDTYFASNYATQSSVSALETEKGTVQSEVTTLQNE